ncbi:MAG TPA: transcription antitermination factor NusB, partial [Candidatus Glassbacteria bacterium]|nr:transcription antitermination factor NusB [Candidatus Glassbacteria bacterium]
MSTVHHSSRVGKSKSRVAAARREALRLLGKKRELELDSDRGLAALEARDRALAREIVAGTLRNRSLLDFRLAGLLEEPENLPPAVLNLLRMSAYQLLYLNRLPPYAVVNDAVELAGGMAKGAFTGVVNGVLRNLARRGKAASLLEPADADPLERLARLYSHPHW